MAVAGKAMYDNAKRTITLTEGPPRLWQGPDVVVADTIVIYLDENRHELLQGGTKTESKPHKSQRQDRKKRRSSRGARELKARGLVKEYGGRRVVDDVSLRIHSGQVVGLLGTQRSRQDHDVST